jgi:hypothetical protein
MESVREDDPERGTLNDLLVAWSDIYGTGYTNRVVLRDVIEAIAETRVVDQTGARVFVKTELRNAVLAVMPQQRQPESLALGHWLRRKKNRVVNGMWFNSVATTHGHQWWVERQDGQQLASEM